MQRYSTRGSDSMAVATIKAGLRTARRADYVAKEAAVAETMSGSKLAFAVMRPVHSLDVAMFSGLPSSGPGL